MRKNEIFENFVKIAQKNGLIASSEHAEHTEKDFTETNPRMDSLSIEQISKLYNVKPPRPADMDYKHNIMEDAHPDPVVISPSYDKLNGLVENNIEGQNIRLRIVTKEPDGHLTQRKYAEKQLVLSLVRVANDLDNQNKHQLRELADFCLVQASEKPLKKTAQDPFTIGILATVVVVFGGIYLKNHLRFISDGLEKDHQKLIAEIDDMIESNNSLQTTVGAGYTYKPELIGMVQDLKNKVQSYYQLYKTIEPIITSLEKPKTAQQLVQMAAQPETKDVLKAYQAFRTATEELLPYIQQVMSNFANPGFKSRMIQDKGIFMNLVDAPQFLHGGRGLVADDFDDVRHGLETYVNDIQNIMQTLQQAESFQQDAKNKIMSAKYQSQEAFGPTEKAPQSISEPEKKESPPWADLEKQLSGGLI